MIRDPFFRVERSSRRLSDDFFAQVASAYRLALCFGLNPRKAIASSSDVPADTVARWIMEARKRGLLKATTAGRTWDPPKVFDWAAQ